MKIAVVTVFPEMLGAVTEVGVTGRAVREGLLEVLPVNPRDYATDRHRSVDDRPYGGGPGMVMRPEPLAAAIDAARQAAAADGEGSAEDNAEDNPADNAADEADGNSERVRVIYLSPQGRRFDDAVARKLAKEPALVLLAGRYEGVDERLIEAQVDEELSIGDYVLSGGELAAMVVIDAVARLLPGVLGHEASAEEDSFVDGLLDCPHYTRPEVYEGRRVPAVLLSGDHAAIARWRHQQALGRTGARRPELLAERGLTEEEQDLLARYQAERAAGDE